VTAVPDPSGHHDDLDADGPDRANDLANLVADGLLFVVPDDASALDADRDAYLRELAAESGLPGSDPTESAPAVVRPHRISGPLVTAVLLVVALVGSLMTVLAPRNAPAPAARPLATATLQPAGEVGGLLPDVTFAEGPLQVPARSIRPAVFLLIPADCADCAEVVSAVQHQVRSHRLQLVLVGPPAQQEQLTGLDRSGAAGEAILALDATGAIEHAYGNGTPTLVAVAADGIVSTVDPGVTATAHLDPDLFSALRAV
jgi:hypothetical protein